jgi:hypothetical protein
VSDPDAEGHGHPQDDAQGLGQADRQPEDDADAAHDAGPGRLPDAQPDEVTN